MTPIRIVIFAKAPSPGFAKTRLIPALGVQGSADLAHRLLIHCVHQALKAKIGIVELCVTPSAADTVWSSLAIPDEVQWSDQGEGDLGERMGRATKRVIDGGESILLIGTDCPTLSADQLQHAANALNYCDCTFVPTFDGGYALLGLKYFDPSIFTEITWSTSTVYFDTLCRLRQLNWSVISLEMRHDIDEPRDLQWLPAKWIEEFGSSSFSQKEA